MVNTKEVKKQNTQFLVIAGCIGFLVIFYVGLVMAPAFEGNPDFGEIVDGLSTAFKSPFTLTWCSSTLIVILVLELIFFVILIGVWTSYRKYRSGEEKGSAEWGDVTKLDKNYRCTDNTKLGDARIADIEAKYNIKIGG